MGNCAPVGKNSAFSTDFTFLFPMPKPWVQWLHSQIHLEVEI